MERNFLRRIMPLLLLAAGAVALRGVAERQLWFDEALTVTNFVMQPNPLDIYRNYAIPNNHILFSLTLRGWAELCWALGLGVSDLSWRFPSLLAGALAVTVMFRYWKRRFGTVPVALVLLGFILSPAFSLYAGAVRGYMFGFLFVLLAFEAGRRALAGRHIFFLWYALAALAAVATVPTNLTALGAAFLLLLPLGRSRRRLPRLLLLAAIPPVLFALFYVPIFRQLLACAALKEGWGEGWRAALVVYAGIAVPLLPLAAAALGGGVRISFGGRRTMATVTGLLVIAAPLLAAAVCRPYPFPRVFLAWWPLWLYLLTAGVARAWCRWGRRGGSGRRQAALLLSLLTVAGWGMAVESSAGFWSRRIIGGRALDDYFRPYYIDAGYRPYETVKQSTGAEGWIFVSFNADPYPLVYYGRLLEVPAERWRFDGPRGRVASAEGCGLLILGTKDDPAAVARRFGWSGLTPAGGNGFHRFFLPAGTMEKR